MSGIDEIIKRVKNEIVLNEGDPFAKDLSALLMEIEAIRQSNRELVDWCYDQFTAIRDQHMDCDVPDSEHRMFHLAEEGIQKMDKARVKERP